MLFSSSSPLYSPLLPRWLSLAAAVTFSSISCWRCTFLLSFLVGFRSLVRLCCYSLGYLPGHIHAFWLIYKKMQAEERYGDGGFRCTFSIFHFLWYLWVSCASSQTSVQATMNRFTNQTLTQANTLIHLLLNLTRKLRSTMEQPLNIDEPFWHRELLRPLLWQHSLTVSFDGAFLPFRPLPLPIDSDTFGLQKITDRPWVMVIFVVYFALPYWAVVFFLTFYVCMNSFCGLSKCRRRRKVVVCQGRH